MTISSDLLKMAGCCLAPLDEERLRTLREFKPPADWDQFCRFCEDRGILNLVYSRFKRAGLDETIPVPIREKMSRHYQNLAVHNELKLRSAASLSDDLREEGVPLLFFKGSSLLLAGDYRDFGERIASDVDVIIDPRRREQADRVLAASPQWQTPESDQLSHQGEAKWYDRHGVLVEVHSRLHDLNGVSHEVAFQRLWEKAREVQYRGSNLLIPSPEDRFIQSAVHFAAHHGFDLTIMLVCIADLAHLAGKAGAPLDWEQIHHHLQRERMLEFVMVVVEAAADLTGYEPLRQGRDRLNSLTPGLAGKTRPLALSLLRTVRQPRVFRGGGMMVAFSRQSSPVTRVRSLAGAGLRRMVRWLHPAGLIFYWELFRFYRRTGCRGHFGEAMLGTKEHS